MINYSSWEEKTVNVSNLRLDDKNPRLSHITSQLSQNELINEMIDNYKIIELAQSISEDGFFPDKNLIVINENSKYVVVEGNRRLAAIKSLLTPELVEGNQSKRFRKLSSFIEPSFINKLKVIIAPSREAANPIIFKEHTDRTSMPWSRIMQAEFYNSQLKNSFSLDELASKYNKSKSEIVSFLKLINMYEIACNLDFQDEKIKEKVLDKQSFNASTLERVYDSQEMKTFLKFDFDNDGKITGKTKASDFKKAYTKIIEDIITGEVNTRTLNSKDDYIKYKEKISAYEPKTTGTFSQETLIEHEPSKSKTRKEQTSTERKRTIQTSSGIIQRGVPFTLEGSTNLKLLYDELKKLSVKSYPNSAAVSFRAFLDKSIRCFLKKKKLSKIPVKRDSEDKQIKLSECSLGEIIDYLIKKDTSILEDNTKKVLKHFKTASDKNSLSALNSIMHNENYSLTEKEVRDIWRSLECLFKEILIEPKE